MFRSRSWFGGGWGRPKNPHSLEHLKYLYNVLARNQTVSEHNRGLLVESLRCIAEILIWGDQNDSSVFDFFLEKNMLSFFLRIMRQRSGGSSYVCVQLLQTLNILFENIRNETSLYYLLSNNHVNSIIVHKFDFSDEEVMAYYISFLKTLSLKLNAHTIHFFYNEHTNDFPLYTEAIKFFNHPESMVRIAVRTLTLNVYRVDDASMLAFIRDRTAAPYFSNIVWFIGKHILELDACVRNDADHQSHNRLADLVAEHLDHLHYINDILCLNIIDLNRVLTEHLLHKLLIPLYIYSLTGFRNNDTPNTSSSSFSCSDEHNPDQSDTTNGRVSSVVALFLLSQVFLIITHAPLVRTLAWIILKADKSIFQKDYKELLEKCVENQEERTDVKPLLKKNVDDDHDDDHDHDKVVNDGDDDDDDKCSNTLKCNVPIEEQKNATDEEKLLVTTPTENICTSPFFEAVMKALDCSENDYTALFSLSLLYALGNNKGIPNEPLRRVLRPEYVESTGEIKYNTILIDKIVQIVNMSCQPTCRVRLVTLELSLKLMLQLVTSEEYKTKVNAKKQTTSGGPLTEVHKVAMETARAQSTALVRNFYKSEEIFLDMFEHEYDLFQLRYCDMTKGPLNVEWLCMDSAILLPPTGTPMTGISFTKRLPCGEVERARRAIRVYFLVRDTFLSLTGEPETQLPLTNPQSCVQVDTVLDLNNSDLISCVVVWKDGQKIRRFLVIDVLQLILVEPDTKKLGWGVVKLVGFLQDIEVVGDKDDSRCLHITIHRPLSASNVNRVPLLSAKFIFDDHIRCMAAKQRLTKGRIKARQKKMQHIARLLDIPGQTGPASPAYVGGGVYSTRIPGRGNRENRPLFCTGRVPGFATPRRDSAPSTSDIVASTSSSSSASRRNNRDTDSPARLLEKKLDKTNGSAKSRDSSSGRNNRSRDGSPRMPRPRSEEIPLELIKRTQSSVEASPKISILPRPQQVQSSSNDDVATALTSSTEDDTTTTNTSSAAVQANEQLNSEETSFIAQQDKRMPRRKGAIETV